MDQRRLTAVLLSTRRRTLSITHKFLGVNALEAEWSSVKNGCHSEQASRVPRAMLAQLGFGHFQGRPGE